MANKSKAKKNRYSKDEKKALLDKYHQLRKGGKPAKEAAEQVGVPYITLRSWEAPEVFKSKKRKTKQASEKASEKRLRQAAAKASQPPRKKKSHDGLEITFPSGMKVSGPTELILQVLRDYGK